MVRNRGLISPLSANIFVPALPSLAAAFSISTEQVNLAITLYLVMQACSPTFWGGLADVVGRRPVCPYSLSGASSSPDPERLADPQSARCVWKISSHSPSTLEPVSDSRWSLLRRFGRSSSFEFCKPLEERALSPSVRVLPSSPATRRLILLAISRWIDLRHRRYARARDVPWSVRRPGPGPAELALTHKSSYSGLNSMGAMLGPTIGPVIGGALSDRFGWRSMCVFFSSFFLLSQRSQA